MSSGQTGKIFGTMPINIFKIPFILKEEQIKYRSIANVDEDTRHIQYKSDLQENLKKTIVSSINIITDIIQQNKMVVKRTDASGAVIEESTTIDVKDLDYGIIDKEGIQLIFSHIDSRIPPNTNKHAVKSSLFDSFVDLKNIDLIKSSETPKIVGGTTEGLDYVLGDVERLKTLITELEAKYKEFKEVPVPNTETENVFNSKKPILITFLLDHELIKKNRPFLETVNLISDNTTYADVNINVDILKNKINTLKDTLETTKEHLNDKITEIKLLISDIFPKYLLKQSISDFSEKDNEIHKSVMNILYDNNVLRNEVEMQNQINNIKYNDELFTQNNIQKLIIQYEEHIKKYKFLQDIIGLIKSDGRIEQIKTQQHSNIFVQDDSTFFTEDEIKLKINEIEEKDINLVNKRMIETYVGLLQTSATITDDVVKRDEFVVRYKYFNIIVNLKSYENIKNKLNFERLHIINTNLSSSDINILTKSNELLKNIIETKILEKLSELENEINNYVHITAFTDHSIIPQIPTIMLIQDDNTFVDAVQLNSQIVKTVETVNKTNELNKLSKQYNTTINNYKTMTLGETEFEDKICKPVVLKFENDKLTVNDPSDGTELTSEDLHKMDTEISEITNKIGEIEKQIENEQPKYIEQIGKDTCYFINVNSKTMALFLSEYDTFTDLKDTIKTIFLNDVDKIKEKIIDTSPTFLEQVETFDGRSFGENEKRIIDYMIHQVNNNNNNAEDEKYINLIGQNLKNNVSYKQKIKKTEQINENEQKLKEEVIKSIKDKFRTLNSNIKYSEIIDINREFISKIDRVVSLLAFFKETVSDKYFMLLNFFKQNKGKVDEATKKIYIETELVAKKLIFDFFGQLGIYSMQKDDYNKLNVEKLYKLNHTQPSYASCLYTISDKAGNKFKFNFMNILSPDGLQIKIEDLINEIKEFRKPVPCQQQDTDDVRFVKKNNNCTLGINKNIIDTIYNGLISLYENSLISPTDETILFINSNVFNEIKEKVIKKLANELLSIYENVSSSLRVYIRINSGPPPGLTTSYYSEVLDEKIKKDPINNNKRSCQTIQDCSVAPAINKKGDAIVYRKKEGYEPVFYRTMASQKMGSDGLLEYTECYPSTSSLHENDIHCKIIYNSTEKKVTISFPAESESEYKKFEKMINIYFNVNAKSTGGSYEENISMALSFVEKTDPITPALTWTSFTCKGNKIAMDTNNKTFHFSDISESGIPETEKEVIVRIGKWSDVKLEDSSIDQISNTFEGMGIDYYGPFHEVYESINRHLDGEYDPNKEIYYGNCCYLTKFIKEETSSSFEPITLQRSKETVWKSFSNIKFKNRPQLEEDYTETGKPICRAEINGMWQNVEFVSKDEEQGTYNVKDDNHNEYTIDKTQYKCIEKQPEINSLSLTFSENANSTNNIIFVYLDALQTETRGDIKPYKIDDSRLESSIEYSKKEHNIQLCCENQEDNKIFSSKNVLHTIVIKDISKFKGKTITFHSLGYTFLQTEVTKKGHIISGQIIAIETTDAEVEEIKIFVKKTNFLQSKITKKETKGYDFNALYTLNNPNSKIKDNCYSFLIDINNDSKLRDNSGYDIVNNGLNDLISLMSENGSGFTVFGYGYSGTGKSYSLFGDASDNLFTKISKLFDYYAGNMARLGISTPQNTKPEFVVNMLRAKLYSDDGLWYKVLERNERGIFADTISTTKSDGTIETKTIDSLKKIKQYNLDKNLYTTENVVELNLSNIINATDRDDNSKLYKFKKDDTSGKIIGVYRTIKKTDATQQDKYEYVDLNICVSNGIWTPVVDDDNSELTNKEQNGGLLVEKKCVGGGSSPTSTFYYVELSKYVISHFFKEYYGLSDVNDVSIDVKKLSVIIEMIHCYLIPDYIDFINKKTGNEKTLEKILLMGDGNKKMSELESLVYLSSDEQKYLTTLSNEQDIGKNNTDTNDKTLNNIYLELLKTQNKEILMVTQSITVEYDKIYNIIKTDFQSNCDSYQNEINTQNELYIEKKRLELATKVEELKNKESQNVGYRMYKLHFYKHIFNHSTEYRVSDINTFNTNLETNKYEVSIDPTKFRETMNNSVYKLTQDDLDKSFNIVVSNFGKTHDNNTQKFDYDPVYFFHFNSFITYDFKEKLNNNSFTLNKIDLVNKYIEKYNEKINEIIIPAENYTYKFYATFDTNYEITQIYITDNNGKILYPTQESTLPTNHVKMVLFEKNSQIIDEIINLLNILNTKFLLPEININNFKYTYFPKIYFNGDTQSSPEYLYNLYSEKKKEVDLSKENLKFMKIYDYVSEMGKNESGGQDNGPKYVMAALQFKYYMQPSYQSFFNIGSQSKSPVYGFTQLAIQDLLERGFKVKIHKIFDLYGSKKVDNSIDISKTKLFNLGGGKIIEYELFDKGLDEKTDILDFGDEQEFGIEGSESASKLIVNVKNELSKEIKELCKKGFSFENEKDGEKKKQIINSFYDIIEKIEKKRIEIGTIKPTPNNFRSSRAHLFIIFKITSEKTAEKTYTKWSKSNGQQQIQDSYMTIIDMAGIENPLEIAKKINMFSSTEALDNMKQKMFNWYLGDGRESGRKTLIDSMNKPISTIGYSSGVPDSKYVGNVGELNNFYSKKKNTQLENIKTKFESAKESFINKLKEENKYIDEQIKILNEVNKNIETPPNTLDSILNNVYNIFDFIVKKNINRQAIKYVNEEKTIFEDLGNKQNKENEEYNTYFINFEKIYKHTDKQVIHKISQNVKIRAILTKNSDKVTYNNNLNNFMDKYYTGQYKVDNETEKTSVKCDDNDFYFHSMSGNSLTIDESKSKLKKNIINSENLYNIFNNYFKEITERSSNNTIKLGAKAYFLEKYYDDFKKLFNLQTRITELSTTTDHVNALTPVPNVEKIYEKQNEIYNVLNFANFFEGYSKSGKMDFLQLLNLGYPLKDWLNIYLKAFNEITNDLPKLDDNFLKSNGMGSGADILSLLDMPLPQNIFEEYNQFYTKETKIREQLEGKITGGGGNVFEPEDNILFPESKLKKELLQYLYYYAMNSRAYKIESDLLTYNVKPDFIGEFSDDLSKLKKLFNIEMYSLIAMIEQIINEGYFINETITHLVEYFNHTSKGNGPTAELFTEKEVLVNKIKDVLKPTDGTPSPDIDKYVEKAAELYFNRGNTQISKKILFSELTTEYIPAIEQNYEYEVAKYLNSVNTSGGHFKRKKMQGGDPSGSSSRSTGHASANTTTSSAESVPTTEHNSTNPSQTTEHASATDPSHSTEHSSSTESVPTIPEPEPEPITEEDIKYVLTFLYSIYSKYRKLASDVDTNQQSTGNDQLDEIFKKIHDTITISVGNTESSKAELKKYVNMIYDGENQEYVLYIIHQAHKKINSESTENDVVNNDKIIKTLYELISDTQIPKFKNKINFSPNYWKNATDNPKWTFEGALKDQLKNTTENVKMIPLLQYLKYLTNGKSKYVMFCLIRPEIKAQYCEGARKGLQFAESVASSNVKVKKNDTTQQDNTFVNNLFKSYLSKPSLGNDSETTKEFPKPLPPTESSADTVVVSASPENILDAYFEKKKNTFKKTAGFGRKRKTKKGKKYVR